MDVKDSADVRKENTLQPWETGVEGKEKENGRENDRTMREADGVNI